MFVIFLKSCTISPPERKPQNISQLYVQMLHLGDVSSLGLIFVFLYHIENIKNGWWAFRWVPLSLYVLRTGFISRGRLCSSRHHLYCTALPRMSNNVDTFNHYQKENSSSCDLHIALGCIVILINLWLIVQPLFVLQEWSVFSIFCVSPVYLVRLYWWLWCWNIRDRPHANVSTSMLIIFLFNTVVVGDCEDESETKMVLCS